MTENDEDPDDDEDQEDPDDEDSDKSPSQDPKDRRKYKIDLKPGEVILCPKCNMPCEAIPKLVGHFNNKHPGFKLEDFKDKLKVVSKKELKTKSSSKPQVAQKMTEEEKNEMTPEIGDAARARGRLKQLLLTYASLPVNKRTELLAEREALAAYLAMLAARDVPYSRIKEIESDVETNIAPALRDATGQKIIEPSETPDESPKEIDTDLKMKIQKLRSNIKANLQKIADMPANLQETINAEKDTLITLNRKLCKEDIVKKEVTEIEAIYSSIQPYVEAATRKSEKYSKRDPEDEDDEDEEDDIEEAREMKRLKRKARKLELRAEIKAMRTDLGLAGGAPNATAPQPIMVPRPKIDQQTGQQMVDANGTPITEMTYQYPLAQDPIQATLLTYILDDMKYKNRNNGGDSMEKFLMEMKKEDMEWRHEFMEMQYKNKDNSQSEEVRELRKQTQILIDRGHQREVEQLSGQIENMQALVSQNPIDRLLAEKQKLIALGIAQDPGTARALSSQEQSLAYSKEALDKSAAKLDSFREDMKELGQPLIELNTEFMRSRLKKEEDDARAKGQAPSHSPRQQPQMTEDERKRKWKEILEATDHAAQQEGQGG